MTDVILDDIVLDDEAFHEVVRQIDAEMIADDPPPLIEPPMIDLEASIYHLPLLSTNTGHRTLLALDLV